MTGRLARAVVHIAVALVPGAGTRIRYREQWLADVDGAAELGLSALPVALGAAMAAVRLAVAGTRTVAAGLLPTISDRRRLQIGRLQLAVAAPYVWALLFYGYARVRLGVTHEQLVGTPYDPKDLLWFPISTIHPPVIVLLAAGAWMVGAALAPVGLVLAIGGRGSARWLPLAGSAVAVAVILLATSDFGAELRTWLLD